VNRALALLQSFVLENGARWGDVATPDQLEDAHAILDQSGPPYGYLTRARGYSKSTDLAAMALAAMLVQAPSSARLYGLAADRDQARLLLDSVRGFVQRTPELQGRVQPSEWRVYTQNGVALEALAADAASSWGLRPYFVVVDEIAQWGSTSGPRTLWESVASAAAKNPACRMVLLTSAGDPAHWSHGVLEHAKADPLWCVHELSGPAPWMDVAKLEEQKRRLPESSYLRLFENVWTASEDRLASLDDLRACVVHDGPLEPQDGVNYVIGVDLGLKRDRTAVAVCHSERLRGDEDPTVGARVVLDRMQVWKGSRLRPVQLEDVEEWIATASARYNRAAVVLDPWQAAGLAQRLKARGVPRTSWSGERTPRGWEVEEFTFSAQSVGRLASTLMLLIRNRALALPDDEELISELANLRLRETAPGVLRIDHDADKHDDRAIALALAAHRLARNVWTQPKPEPEEPCEPDMRKRALKEMLEARDKPNYIGAGSSRFSEH
jgi:phage terminase large subunit-like protein